MKPQKTSATDYEVSDVCPWNHQQEDPKKHNTQTWTRWQQLYQFSSFFSAGDSNLGFPTITEYTNKEVMDSLMYHRWGSQVNLSSYFCYIANRHKLGPVAPWKVSKTCFREWSAVYARYMQFVINELKLPIMSFNTCQICCTSNFGR